MFVEHKEQGEVSEAPAKVLKLSEAIRIGAQRNPQCANSYHSLGRTCAIGAAFVAVNGRLPDNDEPCGRMMKEHFISMPPAMVDHAIHRNDKGETREQIADWLESQGY